MKNSLATAAGAVCLALAAQAAPATDVEFMNWSSTEDANRPKIEQLTGSFTQATGLEVESIGYAWGEMVKNAFLRARTNTLPDVMQVQARLLPTVANIEGIVDFNEVYGREALEEMFPPGFLAFGELNGKQVALPWIGGTIGMVANQRVLDAAGIEEIPATVEAFREALVKIRDNVPNSVPYAMATKNNASILLDYLVWVWTFGGDVVVDGAPVVNSPEAIEALAFMTDLVAERLAAPEIDRPDSRRLFGQEATGFYFDSPQAANFAGEFSGQGASYHVNVVPMATPVLEAGGEPVSIQWGHVIAMFGQENANADSPAAKFVMHVLSTDALVPYALGGGVLPSTKEGQDDARVTGDAYLAAWAANSGTPRRNTIASLDQGAAVADIIGEEVQAAILKQKSPEEAANDMQERLTEILSSN